MKKIFGFILWGMLITSGLAQLVQLDQIARWRNGPCLTVATSPTVLGIFVGNGAQIDILETPFMHPYNERVLTRGAPKQILLRDSILFALSGKNGLGVYGNFYTPSGKEWYFQAFEQPLRRMILVDSTLFVSSDEGLWILDVSQPKQPQVQSKLDYLGYGMAANDSLLFLGKWIFNITSPTNPEVIDTLPITNGQIPYRMQVKGNYLFAIEKSGPEIWDQFSIYDVHDPSRVQRLSNSPLPGDWYSLGYSLAINDSLAFVGYNSDTGYGLLVIQISDVHHPTIINQHAMAPPVDLQLVDSLLLAAAGDNGFFKLNVSNPCEIKQIYNYTTAGTTYHVFYSHKKAYLATLKELNILELRDNQLPELISSMKSVPENSPLKPGHVFHTAAAFVSRDEQKLYLLDYGYGLFEFQANDEGTGNTWSNPSGFISANMGTRYTFDESRNLLFATNRIEGFTAFDLEQWQKLPGSASGYGLDVAFWDTLLAVAVENKGIDFFNYKDASNPQWLSHLDLKEVRALDIHNSYLFVASYNEEMHTSTLWIHFLNQSFFTSGPPQKSLTINFKGLATDIAIWNNTIFVTDADFGLRQFKYVNLDTVYPEFTYPTYGTPQAIYLQDDPETPYLLLADGEDGLFIFNIDIAFGIDNHVSFVPEKICLEQNYPNPFNARTTIAYQLTQTEDVCLTIFNLKGETVKDWRFKRQSAGRYELHFDASHLASGLYFYRLQTASGVIQARKMVLLK